MVSTLVNFSRGNQIVATLDKTLYRDFLDRLEVVQLSQGAAVYEADSRIDYVYFPTTAVFSMLATMEDGSTAEVGPVGREGLVGLRIFLGADTSPDRVVVHLAGNALRLKTNLLKGELARDETALRLKLLRYTQMLLVMTGRTGACSKLHSLEQQLARWLLTMNDYIGGELHLTHELMALTLGVRRAGISVAASDFRTHKLIDYARGSIRIINKTALEELSCECYGVIKKEYEDLYSDLSK
jgi:CRP-like cAMP-binding protein